MGGAGPSSSVSRPGHQGGNGDEQGVGPGPSEWSKGLANKDRERGKVRWSLGPGDTCGSGREG